MTRLLVSIGWTPSAADVAPVAPRHLSRLSAVVVEPPIKYTAGSEHGAAFTKERNQCR